MGLTCSVLGHEYGERERTEERDDQGSEIIVTIREVRTCARCGHNQVVSESKEVTAAHGAREDASLDEDTETQEQPDAGPVPDDTPAETPVEEDDGLILEDEPAERDPGEWPAPEVTDEEDKEAEDVEWPPEPPAEETEEADIAPAWPDIEAEDEGYDAVSEDAEDDFAGQVIEAVGSTGAIAEEAEETEAGFVRAAPMADTGDADLETEYYCPQCDWTGQTLIESVRRGDICPECRRGYIAEREIQ